VLAPGPLGLILGQLVAKSGGIGTMLKAFYEEIRKNLQFVRWRNIRRVAWRYRGFPLFRMPSHLLLAFSQQAPVIFAISIFGVATGGQLSLALAVLALPLNLLGGAVSKALYGEAARVGIRDPKRLLILVKETQVRLFYIAIIPALIIFLAGPRIFQVVFGEHWEEAGKFASFLSLYLLFQFTSAPLMQVVNLFKSQSVFLYMTGARAIGISALLMASQRQDLSAISFVCFYSIFMAVFYVVVSVWVVLTLKNIAAGN